MHSPNATTAFNRHHRRLVERYRPRFARRHVLGSKRNQLPPAHQIDPAPAQIVKLAPAAASVDRDLDEVGQHTTMAKHAC